MKNFEFRGLEIHSSRMWQQAQVDLALDFIEENSMNALIFNQNDILDVLVYPSIYFTDEIMWSRWPPRNMAIQNNRFYINNVIRQAKKRNIDFYFEAKELYFPAGILEIIPDLRNSDGSLCPYHPFWLEFLDEKLKELIQKVPDFAGIIYSIGTRESMLSISANQCTCEQCKNRNVIDWYYNIIRALFQPLKKSGKKLIIRDFSFTGDQQGIMIEAAKKCSDDIIISLKNTPRDYYPTFPTNPHIGHSGLREWVEFDTWGQFFGLGMFPVSVVEDMQDRMRQCFDKKVEGVYFRTDWECTTEGSSFNSMNLLNVYAGALLSQNINRDLDDVYRTWVKHGFSLAIYAGSCLQKPITPAKVDAYKNLRDFMKASWAVMEKTNYVRKHLFGESVLAPNTVRKAFDMMIYIHGRDDWEPEAYKNVEPTEENIKIVISEKNAALHEVQQLAAILDAENLGISQENIAQINEMLDLYTYYVKMMRLCSIACFYTAKACSTKNCEDIDRTWKILPEIAAFLYELNERLTDTNYPHYVYFMLDGTRIKSLMTDIEHQLSSLSVKEDI